MSSTKSNSDLFLSAIFQSIGEWTELKHVIEVYGAGGHDASEKLTWMTGVLFDYFMVTPMDQLRYEIHDYIEMMVDNEFDFVPLDRSIDSLIGKLLEYHSLWTSGQMEKMRSIMEERSKINEAKKEAISKETKSIDESLRKMALGSQQTSEIDMDQGSTSAQDPSSVVLENGKMSLDKSDNQPRIDNDGDGEWMTVNSKRRSRKR